jgi:cytochrome P450
VLLCVSMFVENVLGSSDMSIVRSRWLTSAAPALRRDPLQTYLDAWRKQGDVVRFQLGGPFQAYLVVHPSGVERVLRTENQLYGKVAWHNACFKQLLGNGLATSEGDRWLSRRRLLQPAFHREAIASMATTMVTAAEETAARWDGLPPGEPIDVSREMMRLTLTVAARSLLGVEASEDAARIGSSIDQTLLHVFRRIESMVAFPLIVPTPANRRFVAARAQLDAWIMAMISRRRLERSGPPNFLDLLLDARDADTGAQLSDRELRDEVMTMLMAGHESTSVALTWAWYLLDRHPNEFEALKAEVDEVVGARPVELGDLPRLIRTSMVVDETLRLYPPAWSTSRSPIRDDEIDGHRIPRGKFVIVSPYVTHRHPAFWSDPEAFRPERFTDGIPSGNERFAYFPFGGGPRQCMGAQFALTEARIVLATLAGRFRPKLVADHDARPNPSITLRPLGGMPMTVLVEPLRHRQVLREQRDGADALRP